MSQGRIGLIAGSGRFPFVFARAAKRQGLRVVCCAVRGEAPAALRREVDRFFWVGLARIASMIRRFKQCRVTRAVMAGKVTKKGMHSPLRWFLYWPDMRSARMWWGLKTSNRSDDSILLATVAEFAKDGITIESALDYCPEILVNPGVLTRRQPTDFERCDIDYGWHLAKEMGRLDVGQTVCVMEQAVLAVEAIEGTDEAILRAGRLCRSGGFTVVKVAKPQQDMRFDVPTVGQQTIQTMRKAGARVLAIEANKTIIIDEPDTIALADRYHLTIVAREPDAPQAETPQSS